MIRPRFRHTGRPCCLILLCLLLLPWLGACAPQYGVSVDSLRGPQADNAGTVYVPRPGGRGRAIASSPQTPRRSTRWGKGALL